jgi:hypothetical protein
LADLQSLPLEIEPLHVMPGRARFRVPGLYHCPALKHAIERELALRHQIERVSANPLTGNVLVEFDKRIDPSEIATLLQEIIRAGDYPTRSRSSTDLNSRSAKGAVSGRNGASLGYGDRPASLVSDEFSNSGKNLIPVKMAGIATTRGRWLRI